MMRRKHRVFGIFIFLAVAAGLAAVVMLLWNAIIPAVIGWTAIGYWQALGLMVLCRILFGGFGKRGGHPFMNKMREMNKDEHRKFHEKLRTMSKDERRDFIRQRMMGGFPFEDKPEEKTEE